MNDMVSKKITVINKQGMHMRPAGTLATEMKKYPDCTVILKNGDKSARATAVMQIMAAGIKYGSEIEITAEGNKEQEALDKAVTLFESGFGE